MARLFFSESHFSPTQYRLITIGVLLAAVVPIFLKFDLPTTFIGWAIVFVIGLTVALLAVSLVCEPPITPDEWKHLPTNQQLLADFGQRHQQAVAETEALLERCRQNDHERRAHERDAKVHGKVKELLIVPKYVFRWNVEELGRRAREAANPIERWLFLDALWAVKQVQDDRLVKGLTAHEGIRLELLHELLDSLRAFYLVNELVQRRIDVHISPCPDNVERLPGPAVLDVGKVAKLLPAVAVFVLSSVACSPPPEVMSFIDFAAPWLIAGVSVLVGLATVSVAIDFLKPSGQPEQKGAADVDMKQNNGSGSIPPPPAGLSPHGELTIKLEDVVERFAPPPIDLSRVAYAGPIRELWRGPARRAAAEETELYQKVNAVQIQGMKNFHEAVRLYREAVDHADAVADTPHRQVHRGRQRQEEIEQFEAAGVKRAQERRDLERLERVANAQADRDVATFQQELKDIQNEPPPKSAEARRAEARERRITAIIESIQDERDLLAKANALKLLYPDDADEIDHQIQDALINLRERR